MSAEMLLTESYVHSLKNRNIPNRICILTSIKLSRLLTICPNRIRATLLGGVPAIAANKDILVSAGIS